MLGRTLQMGIHFDKIWTIELLTSCGNPRIKMEHLEPKDVVKYPNKITPPTEPIELDAPIHERSSIESGPVLNGVCSDWSSGSAIEYQPIPQPNASINTFAFVLIKKKR